MRMCTTCSRRSCLRYRAFLEPELIPVVVPDFILLCFILLCFILPDFILVSVAPGPTLPSLDAPGAGCVCADAIVVVPKSAATTRAEIASLDRMGISRWMNDAGSKPAARIWVPDRALTFSRGRGAPNPLYVDGTQRLVALKSN